MSKVPYFKGALAGGALVALGGFFAPAAMAAPPPAHGGPLTGTLSHSGTGSAAVWDGPNAVKLTVGSTSGTYAELAVNNPPAMAPTTAPSFTTDNYAAGSPRWVIEFSSGCDVFGYPAQLGGSTNTSFTGNQWSVNGTSGCGTTTSLYVTYAAAVAAAGSTHVTGAFIVADGDQSPGTTDTITDISYGGRPVGLGSGHSPQPQPTRPGRPGGSGGQHHHHPQPTSRGGEISSFTDYSASCLTASGNHPWSGLVLDACGANGGAGQDFAFDTVGHTPVLEAVTGNNGHGGSLCVTAPRGQGQLTLQPCTGRASQDVTKHGAYYVFNGDNGYVMDDAKWSTAPGSPVIAFPNNGGRNQRWSSPGA